MKAQPRRYSSHVGPSSACKSKISQTPYRPPPVPTIPSCIGGDMLPCERDSRLRSSILSPTNTCQRRNPEQPTRLSLICSVLIYVCWIIPTHKLTTTGWVE